MKSSGDAFFLGVIAGFIFLAIVLMAFSLTPRAVLKEARQEAVASGHAEWVIETNESGKPEMKFQWKQLK